MFLLPLKKSHSWERIRKIRSLWRMRTRQKKILDICFLFFFILRRTKVAERRDKFLDISIFLLYEIDLCRRYFLSLEFQYKLMREKYFRKQKPSLDAGSEKAKKLRLNVAKMTSDLLPFVPRTVKAKVHQ